MTYFLFCEKHNHYVNTWADDIIVHNFCHYHWACDSIVVKSEYGFDTADEDLSKFFGSTPRYRQWTAESMDELIKKLNEELTEEVRQEREAYLERLRE